MITATKLNSDTDNINPFDYQILTRNKFITIFIKLT